MFMVLALAVALFIFVMGAWGVFAPGSIFAFISGWSSKAGFWLAVLLRLCFGLALACSCLPYIMRERCIVGTAANHVGSFPWPLWAVIVL